MAAKAAAILKSLTTTESSPQSPQSPLQQASGFSTCLLKCRRDSHILTVDSNVLPQLKGAGIVVYHMMEYQGLQRIKS